MWCARSATAALIHIDRHLVHEGTSRNAFDALRAAQRRICGISSLTFAVIDHDPFDAAGPHGADLRSRRAERIGAMQENCREFGAPSSSMSTIRSQGIVHVIATELGIVLPGMTVVCGDSHTATSGGVGAWAWGIGTTEVEHVLATQTLLHAQAEDDARQLRRHACGTASSPRI